jgi:hypothetical protein
VFVAMSGQSLGAAVSVNGLSWQQRTLPTSEVLQSTAYGNGTWVALGFDVAISSTNTGLAFTDISGATSASLALTGLSSTNNGELYQAVVSATGATSVTSQSAALTVS